MNGDNKQGYFFIAIGKQYIDECVALAKTIRKCGDNRPISLLIDPKDEYYAKSKEIFHKYVYFQPSGEIWNECKTGFEKFCLYPRLHLNDYLIYDETIIVDSDVLCQFSTNKLWQYLSGQEKCIVMLGRKVDHNWHWGHIDNVIKRFGRHVSHVHGGFFYLRKNSEYLGKFFSMAKFFFWSYDDFDCRRAFRGGKVDEILFALTHSFFNMMPLEFDEFPAMTFNIDATANLPTKLQTEGGQNIELIEPAPFIHFFDKLGGRNHSAALMKILNYGE